LLLRDLTATHELATRHGAPAHLGARLFLAGWGYVFPRDLARARTLGFAPLALAEATGPSEGWPAS
jgi:hypothetical protein